jgi:hypothetical protein
MKHMLYHETLVNNTTMGGTVCGTVLVLFNFLPGELTKTALLAATGAVVSFVVSLVLSELARRLKRRYNR